MGFGTVRGPRKQSDYPQTEIKYKKKIKKID